METLGTGDDADLGVGHPVGGNATTVAGEVANRPPVEALGQAEETDAGR